MKTASQGTSRSSKPNSSQGQSKAISRQRGGRGILVTAGLGLIVSISVATFHLGAQATSMNQELSRVNQLVPELKNAIAANDATRAESLISDIQAHTSAARETAMDPAWRAASILPGVGDNFRAASEVAISADDVATLAGKPLVSILRSLDPSIFALHGGRLDTEPLSAAAPTLMAAAHAVGQSSDRLEAIDADSLLGQITGPLQQAREQLRTLREGLDAAADTARIVPSMMGDQSPRNYLLLVQNNAESRASGGIPGALAVLTVDRGQLSLGAQSNANALGKYFPAIRTDPEQEAIYSARLGTYMQDVNLTPDFPTTGEVARKMWEDKTGESVDGVISIDPVALGYLLEATGPIELTDPAVVELTGELLPTRLSSANIVPTLMSDVYDKIAAPEIQDVYFAGVAQQVFQSLTTSTPEPTSLVEGLSRSAREGRILVWSADSQEQSTLADYTISGSVTGPSVSPAQFGVYFNDGTGAKMDFYMRRTVQLVKECPMEGYEQTTVRISSTNTAPVDAATSLPPYVTGGGVFGVPAGSVQTNIVAYGPVQANVEMTKLDGQKREFAPYIHGNRPVGVYAVRLAPGESKMVEFTFGKIVQHTEPNVVVTPTVQQVTDVTLPTITSSCT